ncbi:hypothetical protein CTI12_AA327840 [Artemisia annua]|uniref:Reverse transcriptase domain-containing protein n=1 Tax=Artemisia annua TaxID=35608 RepID=A0A2U1MTR6_ARTAN|nr:hypothetical protein CTI12_AA327840 [Artemisia annua]
MNLLWDEDCRNMVHDEARYLVLRKNDVSKTASMGKLSPNWEGPYTVRAANSNGSYMISTMEGDHIPLPWHSTNLRKCHL